MATAHDLLICSVVLTPWAVLGLVKFSSQWRWDANVTIQALGLIVLIWGATLWRLW
ncbi:MAG TPA: hypothetical protein VF829_00930 [Candidatus Paceibacterota bacterium]